MGERNILQPALLSSVPNKTQLRVSDLQIHSSGLSHQQHDTGEILIYQTLYHCSFPVFDDCMMKGHYSEDVMT